MKPITSNQRTLNNQLFNAVWNRDLQQITQLLNQGANIEVTNQDGFTPLHSACYHGHREVVQLLLDKGAKLEVTDQNGDTPFHIACGYGHREVMQLLLDKGAKLEVTDQNGFTPLHSACYHGHREVVQLLLDKGAKLEVKGQNGDTPLCIACFQGHREVVQLLSDKGAKLEVTGQYGFTPLHIACGQGHREVAQLLLDKGAKLKVTDQNGYTPLHSACHHGHWEVVQLLLDKGAKLEITDQNGYTPLHIACGQGHREAVQLLLERGANALAKTTSGVTPLTLAKFNPQTAIITLLENHLKLYLFGIKPYLPFPNLQTADIFSPTNKEKEVVEIDQLKKEVVALKPSNEQLAKDKANPMAAQTTSAHSFLIPFSALEQKAVIGQGGFGKVFKGSYNFADVAIKELLLPKMTAEAKKEFEQEANLVSSLKHPHVVYFLGACMEEGHYALVMEYLPKGSLYDVLHHSKENLTWPTRIQLVLDTGEGLAYLHGKNILHRDLKSLNVLITNDYRAKLTDFGFSKIKHEIATTTQHSGMGTLLWMAPELINEETSSNQKTDVYSYGMVMWEIAARQVPFKDKKPAIAAVKIIQGEREKVPEEAPKGMAMLIAKCWAQRAEDRPTIIEAVKELQQVFSSNQTQTIASTTTSQTQSSSVNYLPNPFSDFTKK